MLRKIIINHHLILKLNKQLIFPLYQYLYFQIIYKTAFEHFLYEFQVLQNKLLLGCFLYFPQVKIHSLIPLITY